MFFEKETKKVVEENVSPTKKPPVKNSNLKKNANTVKQESQNNEALLLIAAEKGNHEGVELLINAKAKVNSPSNNGKTPLIWPQSMVMKRSLNFC